MSSGGSSPRLRPSATYMSRSDRFPSPRPASPSVSELPVRDLAADLLAHHRPGPAHYMRSHSPRLMPIKSETPPPGKYEAGESLTTMSGQLHRSMASSPRVSTPVIPRSQSPGRGESPRPMSPKSLFSSATSYINNNNNSNRESIPGSPRSQPEFIKSATGSSIFVSRSTRFPSPKPFPRDAVPPDPTSKLHHETPSSPKSYSVFKSSTPRLLPIKSSTPPSTKYDAHKHGEMGTLQDYAMNVDLDKFKPQLGGSSGGSPNTPRSASSSQQNHSSPSASLLFGSFHHNQNQTGGGGGSGGPSGSGTPRLSDPSGSSGLKNRSNSPSLRDIQARFQLDLSPSNNNRGGDGGSTSGRNSPRPSTPRGFHSSSPRFYNVAEKSPNSSSSKSGNNNNNNSSSNNDASILSSMYSTFVVSSPRSHSVKSPFLSTDNRFKDPKSDSPAPTIYQNPSSWPSDFNAASSRPKSPRSASFQVSSPRFPESKVSTPPPGSYETKGDFDKPYFEHARSAWSRSNSKQLLDHSKHSVIDYAIRNLE